MKHEKQITPDEVSALRREAAEASVERDVAVYTAVRASGREAAAIEDAKEQRADASIALAQAIDERDTAVDAMTQAIGREALALEDAQEQHSEMLSAQATESQMNTLRHAATVRANTEARGAAGVRFQFYVVMGLVLAAGAAAAIARMMR